MSSVSQLERDLDLDDVPGYTAHSLESERRAALMLLYVAIPLFLSWALYDLALEPHLFARFLAVRGACTATVLALILVLRSTTSLALARLALSASVVGIGTSVAYFMTLAIHHTNYVLGLSLVFLGAGLVAQWPGRTAIATFATLCGTSTLVALVARTGIRTVEEMVGALFYVSTAAVLMTALAFVRKRAHRRSYALALRLEQRNQVVAERERSIRLLLDSTGEGFAGIELSGRLAGTGSQSLTTWFGEPEKTKNAWDYFAPHDEVFRDTFELGFAQMVEGVLPFGLAAEQMPKRLVRDGRFFDLSFRQVFGERGVVRVLVTVRDVTASVEGERAQSAAREEHAILAHVIGDREAVCTFVGDTKHILEQLGRDGDPAVMRRLLHTLKGNASLCGFTSVAEECDAIETELADVQADALSSAQLGRLSERFSERLESMGDLLRLDRSDRIELHADDIAEITAAIEGGASSAELLEIVDKWAWTRTSDLLTRLGANVARVAAKMGKRIEIEQFDRGLRLAPGVLDEFFTSLVHVARNAVDHGIESPEERTGQGKKPSGTITLQTRIDGAELVVEVSDDGRGIDTAALSRVAALRNLSIDAHESVVDALFMDGITTRDEVTELSGRGVGLAAVKEACRKAGGHVDAVWTESRGTTFTFAFPSTLARAPRGFFADADGEAVAA